MLLSFPQSLAREDNVAMMRLREGVLGLGIERGCRIEYERAGITR
jgi:hypothetical protein